MTSLCRAFVSEAAQNVRAFSSLLVCCYRWCSRARDIGHVCGHKNKKRSQLSHSTPIPTGSSACSSDVDGFQAVRGARVVGFVGHLQPEPEPDLDLTLTVGLPWVYTRFLPAPSIVEKNSTSKERNITLH